MVDCFVKEDVPHLQTVRRSGVIVPEKIFNALLIHLFHDLIVEDQPEVVRLDRANVMTLVGAIAAMHNNRDQAVQTLRVVRVLRRDEQPQLQREDDAVRQLLVPVIVLDVLEPLQVQSQDLGLLLDAHALLCFLLAAARLAEVLLRPGEGLHAGEAPETVV